MDNAEHVISMEDINNDVDRARYALNHNILTQTMPFAMHVIRCAICEERYKCSTAPNPVADSQVQVETRVRFEKLPKE